MEIFGRIQDFTITLDTIMELPFEKQSELIVVALFSSYFHSEREELAAFLSEQLKTSKKKTFESIEIAETIQKNLEKIDKDILAHLKDYSLERLGKVELAILRYCVYLLDLKDKNEKQVIAEGIRLCKKFTSPQASDLVHAVLDAIIKERASK